MPEHPLPTEQEVLGWIRQRRNWGRWGKDDQVGALNLITPAKRAAAARLVRSGRSVSLSRPFPKEPGPNNPLPAHHFMRTHARGKGGFSADYYGIYYHGIASTHIDALCHTWDEESMWNGRDPKKEITFEGARFGSVEHWAEGIMTRAVMLDVPRHRGVPCVTHDQPVHGWELDDILTKRGIRLEPGDAVCVYSGREAWQAQDPERPYGRPFNPTQQQRPGLHVSCLPFLRDHDVSVLGHARSPADRLRHPVGGPRRNLRVRRGAGGQRAPRAARARLRGGAARRVHAARRPIAGGRGHRVAGESARRFLVGHPGERRRWARDRL